MRQISGEIRVVHLQNYQLNSISRVRTELILLVEILADRAGFEPTSPAPKAGRISRLP